MTFISVKFPSVGDGGEYYVLEACSLLGEYEA